MVFQKEVYLGTIPDGQRCSLHIKHEAISDTGINDYGIVVGYLKTDPSEDLVIAVGSDESIMPTGVTTTGLTVDKTATPKCISVMKFRNAQAVEVKTTDTTASYGEPVFIDEFGLATQTVTSGWHIGTCVSKGVMDYGVGINEGGLSFMTVELKNPPTFETATAPIGEGV